MALKDGQDFLTFKHANYTVEDGMYNGVILVVPNRIIVFSHQKLDLGEGRTPATLKESWEDLKESTTDIKRSFQDIANQKKTFKAIKEMAAQTDDLEGFANEVGRMASGLAQSLDVDVSGLRKIEFGRFKGIRLTWPDGRLVVIRTARPGAIRKLLGFDK